MQMPDLLQQNNGVQSRYSLHDRHDSPTGMTQNKYGTYDILRRYRLVILGQGIAECNPVNADIESGEPGLVSTI